jgi:hypothetical protein
MRHLSEKATIQTCGMIEYRRALGIPRTAWFSGVLFFRRYVAEQSLRNDLGRKSS